MENTPCILCHEPHPIFFAEIPDYLMERGELRATYVKCPNCGLIYQDPRPSPDAIKSFYPAEYDSYQEDKRPKSSLYSRINNVGVEKRCHIVNTFKQGGRLLDVGCATGKFLEGMHRYLGWELHGVELDPEAASVARRNTGLPISTGTLEEAGFPSSFFDAVTLWDVLEHLPTPLETLEEIYRILNPEGVLVLRVPNAGSWDARLFGKYWFGMDSPRHFYVFDVRTASELIKQSGFEVKNIDCTIGGSVSLGFNLRFWLAGKKMPFRIRRILQNIIINPVARLLSLPIDSFYGRKLAGSFITITAVRRSEVDDRNPA